ncbi:DUF3618 domain-containing protein [Mycolicibacterium moriokaense]|nr:DUF3618 domain-containing protein [Mycolicibacterium moriokaense]
MSQPERARPEPGPDAGIEDIRSDIEQTRSDLGETVEALTAKMDVKQRTMDKATEAKEAVADKAHAVQHTTMDDGRAKVTVPVAAAIVVGTGALVWLLWRRRR